MFIDIATSISLAASQQKMASTYLLLLITTIYAKEQPALLQQSSRSLLEQRNHQAEHEGGSDDGRWRGGGSDDGRARGAAVLELQRVDGQRHVLLVGAALGRGALALAGPPRLRGMRGVEHGAQHGGDGGDVGRLVLGQQPRQAHQLAVPAQHPPLALAAGDLAAHVPLQLQREPTAG
jgi:hypothetical protein